MSLTAFFDESGTHAGSGAVVVAGYLARSETLIAFAEQWRAALGDFGLDFFHMTSFANGAPPYADWSPQIKRERLERLIGIVNSHVIGSIGVAIPMSLFETVVAQEAKAHFGGPYGMAAQGCFIAAAGLARTSEVDPWLNYVFESGAAGSGQVAKAYRSVERSATGKAHFRLRSLRFENKRRFVPLQAADIVAYEMYRLYRIHRAIESREPRRHHVELLWSVPHFWAHVDESDLRFLSEMVEFMSRETFVRPTEGAIVTPQRQRSRRRSSPHG